MFPGKLFLPRPCLSAQGIARPTALLRALSARPYSSGVAIPPNANNNARPAESQAQKTPAPAFAADLGGSGAGSTASLAHYVEEPVEATDKRPRLVIVGSGWGGYSLLRHVDQSKVHVSMVSARPFFLFTPLLATTCVGTLEFRSIQEPVRNMKFQNEGDFHQATVTNIDPLARVLYCESVLDPRYKYKVHYDTLAVSIGMRPNTFSIPGVTEYGHFLKELADARSIRSHLLSNLELALEPGVSEEERARLLTVVIAGGGATGVEFGAELHDFLRDDIPKLYPHLKDMMKIVLVEPNQILSAFDAGLRHFAEKKIQQRKDMQVLKQMIVEVKEKHVVFKDGSQQPYGLLVWATGIQAAPLAKALQFPKNKHNQILVDDYLRVKDLPGVYALGDCAAMESGPLPATAQVAERQGRYLARTLSKTLIDPSFQPSPFKFRSMGIMAYVGEHQAVSDLPVRAGKLRGYLAWWLWISAYLTRLGAWRLRLQVPFDWFRAFVFGRDVSRF